MRNEAAEYRVRPFGCMYVRLIVDITSEFFSALKHRDPYGDDCVRFCVAGFPKFHYDSKENAKYTIGKRNWQNERVRSLEKEIENHVLTRTWFPPSRRNTSRDASRLTNMHKSCFCKIRRWTIEHLSGTVSFKMAKERVILAYR